MTEDKKDGEPNRMSKEEYLKTHLVDMDEPTKRWYMNAMENWTSEDYNRYTETMLWMLGEPTEEDLKEVRELLKKKYGIE